MRTHVIERRKRPLSRGTLFTVYTMAEWRSTMRSCYVTTRAANARAFVRGLPPLLPETDMPGANAAIVRPLRRYL
jgi:hypothetical protein